LLFFLGSGFTCTYNSDGLDAANNMNFSVDYDDGRLIYGQAKSDPSLLVMQAIFRDRKSEGIIENRRSKFKRDPMLLDVFCSLGVAAG